MERTRAFQIAVALLPVCILFTSCEKSASVGFENLTTQNCAAEKFGHAVDAFRLEPTDETRSAVTGELAALDERIQSLEDKAELAEGKEKAQLLFDAKALRTVRAFDVRRFQAPTETVAKIGKAEKAEPVEPAVAVENVEVRRATAVESAVKVEPALAVTENGSSLFANDGVEIRRASPAVRAALSVPFTEIGVDVPARRAIAVNDEPTELSGHAAARIVFQPADDRRFARWQSEGSFSPELARR